MSFRARGGAREISPRDTWQREWLPPQPPTSSSPCGATPRRFAGLLRRAAAIHRVGWTACHRRELYRARGAPRPASHPRRRQRRSEEHTSELQSRLHLVCRLLLEKKKKTTNFLCNEPSTLAQP